MKRASVVLLAWTGLLLTGLASRALAVTHLVRGEPAPPIELNDRDGQAFKLAGQKRAIVVIFGELYHENTLQACARVEGLLSDLKLDRESATSVLVVTRDRGADGSAVPVDAKVPPVVLLDPARAAFGSYRVAVMPSTVVIDAAGKVVYAVAGLPDTYSDAVGDALRLASGQLSPEAFDRALHPTPTTMSADRLKADRVALLGRQLARRGLDEMAAEKLAEALEIDPNHSAARMDLGLLLLRRQRLADAEAQFRTVLAAEPDAEQAALGLAYVQAQRGGAELEPAEKTVREVLARHPSQPRAHFLLGLISEQKGSTEDALKSYKTSAQLLLERPLEDLGNE
jgi:Flp pilus assembly protein TadD/peroxiredoxin